MTAQCTETATSYALYRHFDREGKLLYIGLTNDPERRESNHKSQSFWMELTVRSEVEFYVSLPEVRAAERDAILAEQPLFNKQHNESPEAHARLRAYLIEIRRLDLLPADLAAWQVTVVIDELGWMQIPELGMSWRPKGYFPAALTAVGGLAQTRDLDEIDLGRSKFC